MESNKREIESHLFICCNVREGKPSCGASGDSLELVKRLKTKLRDNNLWDKHKVTKTGCLGPCSQGISGIIFPKNEMVTKISLADEEELYKKLVNTI